MHLTGLLAWLRQSTRYQDAVAQLQAGASHTFDAIRSARPYLLAALVQDWPGPIVYVTAQGKHAYNTAEQLPVWMTEEQRIYRFADPTPMFYDRLPWDALVVQARLETLAALMPVDDDAHAPQPVVITSARALMQRTLPPNRFRKRSFRLQVAQHIDPTSLLGELVKMGYEPVPMVIQPGTFSKRGGIIDLYPMAASAPVRIEFFGDEIDTLRTFDPATQRTTASIEHIAVYPAREALPEDMPQVGYSLQGWFDALRPDDDVIMSLAQDADALLSGQVFPHLEHYLPYTYANPVSLLDYAPADALIVVEDMDDLRDKVISLTEEAEHNRLNNIKTHQLKDDHPQPYVDWDTLDADLQARPVLALQNIADSASQRLFIPGQRHGGQLRTALNDIREKRHQAERFVVVSQQIDRLQSLWYEQDASAHVPKLQTIDEDTLPSSGGMIFVSGELSEGWTLQTESGTLHLLTDAELFSWSRPEPRRRKASKRGGRKSPEADYADWQAGDYVVHIDYGIGRFQGLRSRTIEGNEREYLLVEYEGTDLLFVPIHQADRLTRYVGPDEVPPTMNKLGKPADWLKTRDKARKAAEEEARELLSIYAQRAATSGHAYQEDTAWQRELEASFPYVETIDQLRVLKEVKRDMETHMPMDRLVCGDVGYGKTEVALRAAFKAVMDNKQVAVLVPTTVLANQHYETFQRRMEQFPLKVEMLSRFRTKAEQSRILTQLANGQVDVIIGTHRLLSDDITLPNLGLMIIDEEQRFGVKHKEHFKKLRAHVDILTLTATPIPRTLYMSLSGVRDISMIQTPPEERLPVITHVGPFDDKLARQAVLREIDRGGQVFVIHNRVKTIELLQEKFTEIVPEASSVVAHGQMSGKQLESVISAFTKGQYDILIATSIIENGIDMPNVNTLIVDRADWFGMSQLYQIRGRVGRGAQQAYAYLFHAGSRKLTEEARTRLETLAEHANLGAGFQIAVRDLELRGAGDILSTRQTGHVKTVGLQLYTQLLQQAVSELKGEAETTLTPVSQERIVIDLPLPAYIPNDWIPEMALRLQLYRRIGSLQTQAEVETLREELYDRFGRLPVALDGLLYQIQIKLLASALKATAVIKPRDHILIKLPWLVAVDREALQAMLDSDENDVDVTRTAVELRVTVGDDIWQERLMDVMKALQAGLPEQVDPELAPEVGK